METEISESTDAGIAFQEATKQSYAFKGLHNFEKACRKVYSLNLRQFLEMTDAGRYVLKINENEYMTRKARSVLVDVIINGLMSESQG